jgi:hypothetical protein
MIGIGKGGGGLIRGMDIRKAEISGADHTDGWQDDYQRLLQEFRELLCRHLAIAEDLVEEARPHRLA